MKRLFLAATCWLGLTSPGAPGGCPACPVPGGGAPASGLLGAGASPSLHPGAALQQEAVWIYTEAVDTHPGALFTTPVHLETDEAVGLGKVVFRITYPRELGFEKVHRGYLLPADRFELETEAREPGGSDPGSLTFRLSGSEALPDGLILYLDFRVSEKPETRLMTLGSSILSASTPDGKELEGDRLVGEDQSVYVLRPDMMPIAACMFYMH